VSNQPITSTGLAERIGSGFFDPVPAIRPYLVEKGVLVLVALDLWLLRLGSASRYEPEEMSIAHFSWLDAWFPVPSAALYIGVCVLVGFLAWAIAVAELGRWWKGLLVLLYTYCWAMSRLDSYQHHYLLSWVLLCIVFFPPLRSADLFPSRAEGARLSKRKASGQPWRPCVSAWAWVLLGWFVAIVYFWTSVTKLEPVWLSGACLQQLSGAVSLMVPIQEAFAVLGMDKKTFWQLVASGTIVVELLLAAGYLLAPWQDRSGKRSVRWFCWACGLLAVGLHLGFELAGLKIGWFSFYMIGLACISFCPEGWLWPLGKVIGAAINQLDQCCGRGEPSAEQAKVSPPWIVAACLAGGILIAAGWWVDLPGALPACLIAAVALLVGLAVGIRERQDILNGRVLAALVLAALVLVLSVFSSGARSQFYTYRLAQLQRRGEFTAAGQVASLAEAYVEEDDLYGHFNLARFYAVCPTESLRDPAKAVAYATRACELCDYRNVSALDVLACAFASKGDFHQALQYLRQAKLLLRGKPSSGLLADLENHQQLFSQGRPLVQMPAYRYGADSTDSPAQP